MFHKILACLDESRLTERVLPYVVSEARGGGAKVVLLHVCTRDIAAYALQPGEPLRFIPPELLLLEREDRQARMKAYLEKTTQRLKADGLDVDYVLLSGLATDVCGIISLYAAENGFDLIVMATKGYTGWKRLVFGSVTDCVTRRSAVPVLAFKPSGSRHVMDMESGVADEPMSLSGGVA